MLSSINNDDVFAIGCRMAVQMDLQRAAGGTVRPFLGVSSRRLAGGTRNFECARRGGGYPCGMCQSEGTAIKIGSVARCDF